MKPFSDPGAYENPEWSGYRTNLSRQHRMLECYARVIVPDHRGRQMIVSERRRRQSVGRSSLCRNNESG
jgi:hypothetical protein